MATTAEAGALMVTHALLLHHAAAHHFADHETPDGRQVPAFQVASLAVRAQEICERIALSLSGSH